jgi:hypothetical protein
MAIKQTPADQKLEVQGSYTAGTILALLLIILFCGIVGSAQQDKLDNKANAAHSGAAHSQHSR